MVTETKQTTQELEDILESKKALEEQPEGSEEEITGGLKKTEEI